ncbi:hypothetical protein ENUP19_0378G0041 [Entamoeba nuttalli]|uniref:Rap/Ran GTPase-activating protein, putative n=2 Tax=Entamoeba nuttalli TaxID=412467 RepID=K2HQK4_ENTNP|nr:Rap/Ran GTPase-activating protein, putative [Entamoeba nuttalli P19]EKE38180.1 Rap/Ran GTPase-activating protein, putative [Entamoeba nuttalli P19]|eukprot:XP_008859490.1 Rap/Ran GTPase-activating protein, putative [Entamoeba nuttalli P19]
MTTQNDYLHYETIHESTTEPSTQKTHFKQTPIPKPAAPPPPSILLSPKHRAPPPPLSPRVNGLNDVQQPSLVNDPSTDSVHNLDSKTIIEKKIEFKRNVDTIHREELHKDDGVLPLQSPQIIQRPRSFSDTYGKLKEVPSTFNVSAEKKKKKKKFGLFGKKEEDIIISDPEGFSITISMRSGSSSNPLSRFDGKSEKALYPLNPPLPLLNKRDVSSEKEYFDLIDEIEKEQLFFDEWSSPVVPNEKWEMNYSNDWEKKSLVTTSCIEDGYYIEIGEGACTTNTDLKDYLIVDITSDFNYFNKFVKGNPDAEHYILTEEPTALSIIPATHNGFRRGIVMNKKGEIRCLLPNELEKIKEFKVAFPDLSHGDFYKLSKQNKEKFENEIARIEIMNSISHYKFGILYCQSGQCNEDQMFGNTEGCPAFYKFLDLLGNKIELHGFNKYRGGLDVSSGSTGIYSYFTEYLSYEIMFHVSTLLPEQPGDLQRVEKKRHIGNDVVVIIFKEQGNNWQDQFNPKCLTSQFNHIFIVVQPEINTKDNMGYFITVCCKSSVNPFPPFMTTTHYSHDEKTREFILRKAINAERTAMFSTAFKGNATKTRKKQLSLLFESLED